MAAAELVPATVAEIRGAARTLWDDEDRRASSLNGRASGLTGFVGIIISLAAALGAVGGNDAASLLTDWVRIAVGITATVGLALLVVAVFLAVWKVLLPRAATTISTEDIDSFSLSRFTSLEPVLFDGYLIKAYAQAIKVGRSSNQHKATWLRRSYKLVCVGLALVALAGAGATLDAYVGGDDTPPRARAASG